MQLQQDTKGNIMDILVLLPINHDQTIFPCIPIFPILPDNLVKKLESKFKQIG